MDVKELKEEIEKMIRLETNVFYKHREKAKKERIRLEKKLNKVK